MERGFSLLSLSSVPRGAVVAPRCPTMTYGPHEGAAAMVMFSSKTSEWATPRAFFAKLNRRYRFTLDPCATAENATCPTYFTKEDDGLAQDWGTHRVFCNPPYGRTIGAWVRKSFEASQRGALVVLLAPARTDTA